MTHKKPRLANFRQLDSKSHHGCTLLTKPMKVARLQRGSQAHRQRGGQADNVTPISTQDETGSGENWLLMCCGRYMQRWSSYFWLEKASKCPKCGSLQMFLGKGWCHAGMKQALNPTGLMLLLKGRSRTQRQTSIEGRQRETGRRHYHQPKQEPNATLQPTSPWPHI